MIHILITYSVKEEWTEYNKKLIDGFMDQLKGESIRGVSHVVYRMGTNSFIHICRYKSMLLCKEVINIPSFRHFLSMLQSIVDEEPITNIIEEIGHYPQ